MLVDDPVEDDGKRSESCDAAPAILQIVKPRQCLLRHSCTQQEQYLTKLPAGLVMNKEWHDPESHSDPDTVP